MRILAPDRHIKAGLKRQRGYINPAILGFIGSRRRAGGTGGGGGGPETDPNFASVVLLAGNESAADGTTTFDDASNSNHTLTANGDVQWDTDQAPTGLSSSILFDGTGDFITIPDSAGWHFSNGDFTVEWFQRLPAAPGATAYTVAGQWSGTTQRSWLIQLTTTTFHFAYSTNGNNVTLPAGTYTWPEDTWEHVAVARAGGTIRFFVEGVEKGSSAIAATLFNSTGSLYLGLNNDGNQQPLNGWMAGLRITKGVGRYTGAFTPPDLPLPTA